jgi:hypothetical protein
MEVFFNYRGHEFVGDPQVDVRKRLINFKSEPVAGRDVEALGVVRSFCKNCFDGFIRRLWFRTQKIAFHGHFEEAVDDDEEFLDIGGKSLASDIFLTFTTDFLTEAPALEHLFWNSARPNWKAPVLRSL